MASLRNRLGWRQRHLQKGVGALNSQGFAVVRETESGKGRIPWRTTPGTANPGSQT